MVLRPSKAIKSLKLSQIHWQFFEKLYRIYKTKNKHFISKICKILISNTYNFFATDLTGCLYAITNTVNVFLNTEFLTLATFTANYLVKV